MNIAVLLHQAAIRTPSAPAICESGRVVRSYAELAASARRVSAALTETYGLRRGDRVALAMANTPRYFEVLFGAWWAGLVVTPMNARLHPREFAALIADCAARVCVATEEPAEQLRQSNPDTVTVVDVEALTDPGTDAGSPGVPVPLDPPADVAAEEPAWLFYTSGTTGRSKGATLTHRNLMTATLSTLADLGDGVDASLLHITPMSHAGGLFGLAYIARSRANVYPRGGVLTAETLDEGLRSFGPTAFFGVPTILRRLLDPALLPDETIPYVHRILYGGAPMYLDDLERVVARFGPERLWQGYGQGESPGTITFLSPADHRELGPSGPEQRLASVGGPRTGVQVRVVDPHGDDVPTGCVGEVVVRGDTVMAGYWNNAAATEETLRGEVLHTGDLGRLDERGRLTLVDREKDVIISGGSNIYPRELEEVLLTHPAIAEVAVVGAPDPEWGELPVAFVVFVPTRTATPDELTEHCLTRAARYKRPRRYHFVAALPRNSYGKVLKTELRRSETHLRTTQHLP